jgi:hypothetical protein
MKKFLPWLLVIILAGALGWVLWCQKCGSFPLGKQKKETSVDSYKPTSFDTVAKRLNSGGNLFVYVSTESWMGSLREYIQDFSKLVSSISSNSGSKSDVVVAKDIAGALDRIVSESGLQDISGVGISSVEREEGLYHVRSMLHHYSDKKEGAIWSFTSAEPHELDGLKLCPANTVFASSSDLNLEQIWNFINRQLVAVRSREVRQFATQWPTLFRAQTGLDWIQTLRSLGNEFLMVVTLDPDRQMSFPAAEAQGMKIPDVRLMLALKVKDDLIFNKVDELLSTIPIVTKEDSEGVKLRKIAIPGGMAPEEVKPCIVRRGDYLVIASHDALVEEAFSVQRGEKPGLMGTDEFKKLSRDVPEKGNAFSFMSENFMTTYRKVFQDQLLTQEGESAPPAELKNALQKWSDSQMKGSSYGVFLSDPEGFISIANSTQDPSVAVALVPVATIGMVASIAAPAFIRARQRSQATTTLNYARTVEEAKEELRKQRNLTDSSYIPTVNDLATYLGPGHPFVKSGGRDPLGNAMAIGRLDHPPRVSPQTREELEESTGGEEFWGPYGGGE